jgi:hypothetical protein
VGKDYGTAALFDKLRLLIVGESHYEWCDACWAQRLQRTPDLTAYCIAERISRLGAPGLLQHWSKIENAFLGSAATRSDRRDFWQSVAYYNFLQETVGRGSRIPIKTAGIWSAARAPFLSIVDALRPDLIVVAGRRVWVQLPQADDEQPALHAAGKTLARRRYHVPSTGKVPAVAVPHPARGLGATWQTVLRQAVDEVINGRRSSR